MSQPNEPFTATASIPDASLAAAHRLSEEARWFAEEVQPHEPALRAVLRRLVGSLSDVDDLVQECYLRVVRAQRRVHIRSCKAFLFTTARNAAHDLHRRRSVADPIVFVETDDLRVLAYEGRGVVDSVCHQQELSLLTEAIGELPERCRQVFLLRKIQELPQKVIAQRLGISESTVETLVAKGAARCAEYLHRRGLNSK